MVLEHCTVFSVALIIYVLMNYKMVVFSTEQRRKNGDRPSKISSF